MAKTTLRAYNHEIETLIEQNQFEQAIAHARHILKFFPKHIQSYRLLGKAYLESQRYGDAADVFQRVLSAVPDDFVSHVGMSIIREDEGNLDEAIWHMERAFEVQPANGAIQGELRRLHGRRDGMEPPKVRLTRGALARMYLKGELYQQAIAELRAALAEDPQRPDLLSLLAQAYFLTGQRVESADTCSALLKKTPYCLEANRILAEILSNTERAEEAQGYRQRVQALDPYAAHTSPAAPTPERVSDTAVSLEKLVWSPGQPVSGAPGQPEWATSLGVDIGAAAPSKEALPDWLSEQPEKAPPVTPEPAAPAVVPPFEPPTPPAEIPLAPPEEEEEVIPDWMKEAGWQPAAAAEEKPEVLPTEPELPELPPTEELAPADIPDWLQAMAPGELPVAEEAPVEPGEILPPAEPLPGESEALSWLQETPPGPSDSVVTWLEEEQPPVPPAPPLEAEAGEAAEAFEVPDWLKGLGAEEPAKPIEPEPVAPEMEAQPPTEIKAEEAPEETAGLPDWLAGGAMAAGAAGAVAAEELPDWLKEAGEKAGTEAEAEPGAGLPDWLREAAPAEWEPTGPAAVSQPEVPAVPQEEKIPEQAEDEAFAWLESLAAKQGAEEALILKPEERREAPPDWVVEAASQAPVEPSPPVPEEPVVSEWPSSEIPEEHFAEEEPAAAPAEEIPEWLRGLESQAGPAEEEIPSVEELAEELEGPVEILPEPGVWQPEEQLEAPPVPEEAGLPEWPHAEVPEERFAEEVPAAAPAEEIPEWLRGLEAPTGPAEEEVPPVGELAEELEEPVEAMPEPGAWQPEEQLEAAPIEPAELPDWLKEIAPGPAAEAPAEPEAGMEAELPTSVEEGLEAGELPVWLSALERQPEEPEPELEMLFGPQVMATPIEEAPAAEAEPEAISDTQPTRVRPPEEAVPAEEVELPPMEVSGEEIPEWLRGLGEEQPAPETLFEVPSEEQPIPETLSEAPVEEQPTPETLFEAPAEAPALEALEGVSAEVPGVELPAAEAAAPEAGAPETGAEVAGVSREDEEAFAWLEGLAARMGAQEAMLLTPEERMETPPEWVQKASEEEAAAMPVEEAEIAPTPEAAPEEEIPPEVTLAEGVVPEAVVPEEMPPMEEVTKELVPPQETTLPEVEKFGPVAPMEEVAEELVPPQETALPGVEQFEPVTPLEEVSEELVPRQEMAVPETEQFKPVAPMEEVAEELVQPEAEVPPAEIQPEVPETPPELPPWLAGVEQHLETPEEELAWTPPLEAGPEAAPGPAEVPPRVEPFQPIEPVAPTLDLNEAGLADLERIPGMGYTRALAVVTYRQAFGPFGSVDELLNVAGFDEALVDTLKDRIGVGEVQPAEAVTEAVDIHQVTLIQARNALIQGNTQQAAAHYTSLIKAQQFIPEVLQDLNEALYRFPVDISIWEALGDAHVRSGHLQDALDAYTKAEELIR